MKKIDQFKRFPIAINKICDFAATDRASVFSLFEPTTNNAKVVFSVLLEDKIDESTFAYFFVTKDHVCDILDGKASLKTLGVGGGICYVAKVAYYRYTGGGTYYEGEYWSQSAEATAKQLYSYDFGTCDPEMVEKAKLFLRNG